jgi:hypothetical protein
MRLRDHRLTMAGSFTVTGYPEHLTRAPRVSLQGSSTLFTSVTRAVTAMIRGSGAQTTS